MYGRELQTDITQDVSGGMEEMFVEILKCEREQGDTVNAQQAKEDAKLLYKVRFLNASLLELLFV